MQHTPAKSHFDVWRGGGQSTFVAIVDADLDGSTANRLCLIWFPALAFSGPAALGGGVSLRIRADSGGDGTMSIDRSTAKELELITDARSGGQKKSL